MEELSFGVTERLHTRVGPVPVNGLFLHCNRRHHSLAIFDLPLAKRMHHFMLQVPGIADVGLAYERARRHKVPMSLGFSGPASRARRNVLVDGSTPSGFDFAAGANSREIDPGEWQVHHSATTSSWGHRPTLRLQLKMAGGLLRRKLGMRQVLA